MDTGARSCSELVTLRAHRSAHTPRWPPPPPNCAHCTSHWNVVWATQAVRVLLAKTGAATSFQTPVHSSNTRTHAMHTSDVARSNLTHSRQRKLDNETPDRGPWSSGRGHTNGASQPRKVTISPRQEHSEATTTGRSRSGHTRYSSTGGTHKGQDFRQHASHAHGSRRWTRWWWPWASATYKPAKWHRCQWAKGYVATDGTVARRAGRRPGWPGALRLPRGR